MEKTKISAHLFRSDEIINIVLLGIGVTREDVSTYKDYSYSDGTYLRLRVSDHGLFLQNWYNANKEKREGGESVPKLNIGQNLAITFALNEDECKEKNIPFPQKIKNVTNAQTVNGKNVKPQFSVRHICYYSWKLTEGDINSITTALKSCVSNGQLYSEPIKDAAKYVEWEDTTNLPPRKITNESRTNKNKNKNTIKLNESKQVYGSQNLSNFAEIPKDPAGFEDLFSIAQTGTLDEDGLQKYVTTMVTEYDKLVIGEYYRQEGFAEGKAEEKASIAKKMLDLGLAIPIIQQATGLTEEEIRAL